MSPIRFRTLTSLFAGLTLVASAACGTDSSPLAPTAPVAAHASVVSSLHDLLIAQRDSARAAQQAKRDGSLGDLVSAVAKFNLLQNDVVSSIVSGKLLNIKLLSCKPSKFEAGAEVIGPNGGTVAMGNHRLVIPKGALDHEVLITGEAPIGSRVGVEFAPHGLRFAKPAQLTLGYGQCVLPLNLLNPFRVVYIGDGQVEIEPSSVNLLTKTVQSPIEHFSGYMIAY